MLLCSKPGSGVDQDQSSHVQTDTMLDVHNRLSLVWSTLETQTM